MSTSKIEVVPYSPQWPEIFQAEAALIKQALGRNCVNVHHIGSTSVVGLSAKPIIDMIPEVKDITKVDLCNQQMAKLGYDCFGEYGVAFRRFFTKREPKIGFNIHVFEQGSTETQRHLRFRDWLTNHEADKQAYEDLKKQLAAQYPDDILNYCKGKDRWVAALDKKAGFDGYRMVIALMDTEWVFYERMHQQNNCDPIYHQDSFDDTAKETFFPFVLYKGDTLIGAALVEFGDNHTARLHSICLDLKVPPKESDFYQLLQKWAEQHDRELNDA